MHRQLLLPLAEPSPGRDIERDTAAAIQRARRRHRTTLRAEVARAIARPRAAPSIDEINRDLLDAGALR